MLMRLGRWWDGLGAWRRREVLLLVLLLFAYGFFQQRPAWNELSRYDLVRAIVEQGTIRIDSFHENTGDKAFFEGHWYSDKAPGTAILGVPVYAALLVTSWLAGGGTPNQNEAVQALSFMESGLPTALLVLLLVRFLAPAAGAGWALAVGLAYGLATIAFPFATMFFGHASSTAALFGAFFLLHRSRSSPSRWSPLAAGFLAGWAVLIEIPVVLGVAALFGYALFVGRGVAARFVLGGLPLAAVLLAYNWAAFGSPFSIGYQYTPAFAEQNAQGLVSIVWPSLDTAGELLLSPRGLLILAPWLALAPLGLDAVRRRDVRFEVILAAVICAAFLTYNSGALNPFGGWTPGPRYLLPALPFAALLVGLAPPRARMLAAPLMLVSAALMLIATTTMPNAPERYDDPLFELWLPRFLSGGIADTAAWIRWGLPGFASLAVLALGLALGLAALALSFRSTPVAARVVARTPLALGALALAFSFPFPPVGPVGVAAGGGSPAFEVVELGHATTVVDGDREVELWARIESRGAPVTGVRTRFSVWRASGEGVWSAWYGDVDIEAGARRTIRMTWRPDDDEPAGTYRSGFAISDEVTGADYLDVRDASEFSLGR